MHIYNAEDVRAIREELGTDMFTAKKDCMARRKDVK
jgi:hypothetical protein